MYSVHCTLYIVQETKMNCIDDIVICVDVDPSFAMTHVSSSRIMLNMIPSSFLLFFLHHYDIYHVHDIYGSVCVCICVCEYVCACACLRAFVCVCE